MCSGVAKSGSPAPKPMTSLPAAFSAFAVASTARVAEGAMPAMRAEMREREDMCLMVSCERPIAAVVCLQANGVCNRRFAVGARGRSAAYTGAG